jgi:hypothetical protein
MWIGTGRAIIFVYVLWLVQYIPFSIWNIWGRSEFIIQMQGYMSAFWQNPGLLFGLAGILMLIAFLSSRRMSFSSNLQSV